jgi:hypothetical protein
MFVPSGGKVAKAGDDEAAARERFARPVRRCCDGTATVLAIGIDRVRLAPMRWTPLALLLSCAPPAAQTPPAQQTVEIPAHTQAMIDAYRNIQARAVPRTSAPQCPGEDSAAVRRQKYEQAVHGCVEENQGLDPALDVALREQWPALYAALDAQKDAVERCIREGEPFFDLSGAVTTRLELASDGAIQSVRTVRDDSSAPAVACCVRHELRQARLPAPGRALALELVTAYDHPPPKRTLGKEEIRAVVDAHLSEVRACYDAAASQAHSGQLTLRFVIAAGGEVPRARVVEDGLGSPSAACCVVAKLRSWHFPAPPDGGVVPVTYPFVLHFGG